jgi:cytochrome c oxidase subunit 1
MQAKPLSRWWLLIGTIALAIAGLYSLVLAGGRSPKLGESGLLHRLFHEALVVHVDLSVLVWFLAIACLLWSRATAHWKPPVPWIEEGALVCFALGTLAITLSPLDPSGRAMMSNYIPVIHSPVFFMGLMLVFCGTLLMLAKMLLAPPAPAENGVVPSFAPWSAALITLVALVCFVWSVPLMPPVIDGEQYYDMVFWAGGHVLQFTHTQVLMMVWLSLLAALVPGFVPHARLVKALFLFALLAACLSPLAFLLYDITSSQFRDFFTHQMIALGGLAPAVLLLVAAPALWRAHGARKGPHRACYYALLASVVLFLYGGVLGLLIQGQNVGIPAHYHGSIVGITLAFMGFAYLLLPKLGYAAMAHTRMACLQPVIYGIGQVMHVSGFAWSGGYGALRKTPGGTYEGSAQLAMGLMGGGAGLAAIGGLLFVLVIIRAVRQRA